MADKVLDAKGLNCPLPILKAKKALKEVPDGGTLEILATDPGAVADFQAFSRSNFNLTIPWKNTYPLFAALKCLQGSMKTAG